MCAAQLPGTCREEDQSICCATACQSRSGIFDHTIPIARLPFDVASIKPKHTMFIRLNDLDKKTDFLENPEVVARAKETAATMVASIEGL